MEHEILWKLGHPFLWCLFYDSEWFSTSKELLYSVELLKLRSFLMLPKQNDLVGGLEHEFYDFPYIGNVIIPTGELIFFRGVETTNQWPWNIKWTGAQVWHPFLQDQMMLHCPRFGCCYAGTSADVSSRHEFAYAITPRHWVFLYQNWPNHMPRAWYVLSSACWCHICRFSIPKVVQLW